jgi:hypothetical protein
MRAEREELRTSFRAWVTLRKKPNWPRRYSQACTEHGQDQAITFYIHFFRFVSVRKDIMASTKADSPLLMRCDRCLRPNHRRLLLRFSVGPTVERDRADRGSKR